MNGRFRISANTLAVAMAAVLSVPAFVAAQSSGAATKTDAKTAAKAAASTKGWTVPRTADGKPDLGGYWTSLSFTPMERPAKYGNREFLSDKETQEVFDAGVKHTFDGDAGSGDAENDPSSADYDFKTYGLSPWQNGVRPNHRTSLVVDPPDGRIPPLTAEAKARRTRGNGANGGDYYAAPATGDNFQGMVHADVPTDLGVRTSCVSMSGGPPIVPGGYNSGLFILQSPQTVVIEAEYGTEVRVVAMEGQPHAGPNIHQWHADARGHWEGDTLVVESTNFRPESVYRNANPKTLKITERFKRVDKETIEYSFTIDDPSTWTKPWTAVVPLSTVQGPLFEYDCSENNMDGVNIMAGARMVEKAAADKAKAKAGVPISQK